MICIFAARCKSARALRSASALGCFRRRSIERRHGRRSMPISLDPREIGCADLALIRLLRACTQVWAVGTLIRIGCTGDRVCGSVDRSKDNQKTETTHRGLSRPEKQNASVDAEAFLRISILLLANNTQDLSPYRYGNDRSTGVARQETLAIQMTYDAIGALPLREARLSTS